MITNCKWRHNPVETSRIRRGLSLRVCREADLEHSKDRRQYAHTFHKHQTVCVARAIKTIPDEWKLAILLHEIGHILAGYSASEQAATDAVVRDSGIPISYQDGPYGSNLEYIESSQTEKAKTYLFGCC